MSEFVNFLFLLFERILESESRFPNFNINNRLYLTFVVYRVESIPNVGNLILTPTDQKMTKESPQETPIPL